MRARILVVDDDAPVRVLLDHVLARAGYDVMVAADGEEALSKIRADGPDLVILDLMMPVMDGWEVLRQLRAGGNAPPVLVVSAVVDSQKLMAAGASACLSKPYPLNRLLALCDDLLRQR